MANPFGVLSDLIGQVPDQFKPVLTHVGNMMKGMKDEEQEKDAGTEVAANQPDVEGDGSFEPAGLPDEPAVTPDEPEVEEPKEPEPEKEPEPKEPRGPNLIDLESIEPFGAPDGCTDEHFADLVGYAQTLVDPMAGAKGGRAGRKLEEEGKFAIPAVINEMLRLDLAEDEGFRNADVCQKTLQRICNGMNFGWYYKNSHPEEWHYLNKKGGRTSMCLVSHYNN